MALFRRRINFKEKIDSLENKHSGDTSIRDSGIKDNEIKSIVFKDKTIEIYFTLDVDTSKFDKKDGFRNQIEISKKIATKALEKERMVIEYLIVFFNYYNLDTNKTGHDTYIQFNDNTWNDCKLSVKTISQDRNMKFPLSNSLDLLNDCITNKQEVPLSLLLVQHSKSIRDLRIRYIVLAMAAEIGIKDFFAINNTNLGILINRLPSPSIAKLTSDDIFKCIFGWEIPQKMRKELCKGMEYRNKLIHTSDTPSDLTFEKIIAYQENVQKFLALLYKSLPNQTETSKVFYANLMDFVAVERINNNKIKQNPSATQKELINNQKRIAGMLITDVELNAQNN